MANSISSMAGSKENPVPGPRARQAVCLLYKGKRSLQRAEGSQWGQKPVPMGRCASAHPTTPSVWKADQSSHRPARLRSKFLNQHLCAISSDPEMLGPAVGCVKCETPPEHRGYALRVFVTPFPTS